jgi:hypothetical protein
MKIQNPYTRGYIDYPLSFEPEKLHYHIRHETPFTDRYSEWAVSIISTGDVIYIPYGQNRCRNIYIVTRFYINKEVAFPRGIYTIPISHFTTQKITVDDDCDDDDFEDDDFDDFI